MGNENSVSYSKSETKKSKKSLSQTPTTDIANLFDISLKLKYNTLQLNSASGSAEPMLFTLKTGETKTQNKIPVDLVCVLDTSGSMSGEKLGLLKKTLYYLVGLMDGDDRVAIVSFDNSAKTKISLVSAHWMNRKRINAAIALLFASGGTNITSGIAEALKILDGRKEKNPVTSIFLLSDGQDSGAETGVQQLLNKRKADDNLTIYSFGYGRDHDPKLMNSIAKLGNGNFYFIDDFSTVDECFVDALGGLYSVVGEDCTISIQATPSDTFPNVKTNKGYGGDSIWKVSEDGVYTTQIAQMPSGKSKNYVLELSIPKCLKILTDQQKEVVLAKAIVSLRDSETKEVVKKECELKVHLVNEDEELKQQTPDKEVLSNYYRVRVAEAMQEAKLLAGSGKHTEGKKLLIGLKEELGNSIVKEEELIKGLLDDLKVTITEMEPQVYEKVGKHRLEQQIDSNMCEKSNPYSKVSANFYATSTQKAMVSKAKASKGFF